MLVNVMIITVKDLVSRLVISHMWFGNLAKNTVYGPKVVTHQMVGNVLLHSKWIAVIIWMEDFRAILVMLANVPMCRRKYHA